MEREGRGGGNKARRKEGTEESFSSVKINSWNGSVSWQLAGLHNHAILPNH